MRIIRRISVAVVLTALLAMGGLSGGCTAKSEKDLIGTWRTKLTGYNTVAAGVTQYDQTVKFTEDGIVEMYNTLPGDLNFATGRYELTKLDGHPLIRITWAGGVDKPSQLYYTFQGDKLLTSRAPGSLDLSQELNVGNQDPVVYQRFDGSLPTP
jgi:hypothetical protein